jgi:isocitrate/isopropylmalate dehydrogenase
VIERGTAAGDPLTPDLGGSGTTEAVTDAVCRAIAADNE